MALVQHQFADQQVQLRALGQLALQYLTAGMTSGLTGAQAAMAQAAISGGVQGAVSGNFDLGKILQDVAFAGVSGAATAGFDLNDTLKLGNDSLLGMVNGKLSFANIANSLGDSVITAGLTTAVYGGTFGDNFQRSFTNSVVMTGLADVQKAIGDFAKVNGIAEGSTQHVILHTLAGCVGAAAAGGDCAAGAAAGMAQSIYAGTLDGTTLSDAAQQRNAQLLGGIAAAFASGGDTSATMLASNIALSGITNNRQLHREEVEWLRNNAQAFADQMGISYVEALAILSAEAASRVDSLYASDGGNAAAAAFLDANRPQGLIASTIGNGDFADHNQEWFAATEYQFTNQLINFQTLQGNADIYQHLGAVQAAQGGDLNVFVATMVMSADVDDFANLSPAQTISMIRVADQAFATSQSLRDTYTRERYDLMIGTQLDGAIGMAIQTMDDAAFDALPQADRDYLIDRVVRAYIDIVTTAPGGQADGPAFRSTKLTEAVKNRLTVSRAQAPNSAEKPVASVGKGPLPTGTHTLDPTEISFSQASVSGKTSDGMTHSELVASMRKNGWQGDPVDVVNMPDGAPTSMDNRRLLAEREAGIAIKANVRNAKDPLTPVEMDRFEVDGKRPTTWGEAIQLRVQRQSSMQGVDPTWPERFPNGSIYDPDIIGGQ